jgi:hypothetical protein
VAHFPARPRLPLSIKMEVDSRFRGKLPPAVDFIAQYVGHHHIGMAFRRAERPAADGPHMLLEL